MSPDTIKYFEGLFTVYTDNIRISDIKSNIILFFLAISIPTVAAFRTQLPFYMPIIPIAAASAVLDHSLGPGDLSAICRHAGFSVFHQADSRPRGFCDAARRRQRAPRLVSRSLRRAGEDPLLEGFPLPYRHGRLPHLSRGSLSPRDRRCLTLPYRDRSDRSQAIA